MKVRLHDVHFDAFIKLLEDFLDGMPELTVVSEAEAGIVRDCHGGSVARYILESFGNFLDQTDPRVVEIDFEPAVREGECAVPVGDSTFMCFPSFIDNAEGCDYVRFIAVDGSEQAYWVFDEWRESPQEVMGAICGVILGADEDDD